MTVIPQSYSGESKRAKVQTMFDSIAPRYDLLNHVLSGGIDRIWRKKMVDLIAKENPQSILDVATGTADLAIEAVRLNPKKIVGVDISEGMLLKGREKIKSKGIEQLIELKQADSLQLPFDDGAFDTVMVAFGVRNFEYLESGLMEMNRVVKKHGKVFILEFSQPEKFPVKQLYSFYSKYVLPLIGQLISKQKAAYEYLPESVKTFPYGNKMLEVLANCSYVNTKCIPLTFGIASIYIGEKN